MKNEKVVVSLLFEYLTLTLGKGLTATFYFNID